MKPSTAYLLYTTAGELGGRLAPALPNAFLQGSAQLAAILAIFAAQEAERGAAVRIADNRDLRALFGELAPLAPAPLRARLEATAAETDSDLTIAGLDAEHARLSALLIEVQQALEENETPDANAAIQQIWALLSVSAMRREFHLPPQG